MSADLQGRARLLADVLAEADLGAWKERLRGDCLARLEPTGRALLLRDVLRNPEHLAFETRLRAARGAHLHATPLLRSPYAWVAAALLVLLGAWAVGRGLRPDPRTDSADPASAHGAGPLYEVRTRPVAPALLAPSRLGLVGSDGSRLDVVSTRPLAERLRLASDRPHRSFATPSQAPVERLDDAGLLALLPGRPSAIVETAPGMKRLVLLDPADEAAIVAPRARTAPR